MRNVHTILVGRSRRRWTDNNKLDLKERGLKKWTGLIWLRKGPVARSCGLGIEPCDSLKDEKFID
jgi:hypothetical protein